MEISEKMSQKLEQTKNASKDNKEQLSKVEKEYKYSSLIIIPIKLASSSTFLRINCSIFVS